MARALTAERPALAPALTEREQFSLWYAEAKAEFLAEHPGATGDAQTAAHAVATLQMGRAKRGGLFAVAGAGARRAAA